MELLFSISEQLILLPCAILVGIMVRSLVSWTRRRWIISFAVCITWGFVSGIVSFANEWITSLLLFPTALVYFIALYLMARISIGRLALASFSAFYMSSVILALAQIVDALTMRFDVSALYLSWPGLATQWLLSVLFIAMFCQRLRKPFEELLSSSFVDINFWSMAWAVPFAFSVFILTLTSPRVMEITDAFHIHLLLCLLLVTIVSISVMVYFVWKSSLHSEYLQIALMQSRMDDHLRERIDTTRRTMHDLRQHYLVLEELAYTERYEELCDYLQVCKKSFDPDRRLIYCDNVVANSIVTYYCNMALDQGAFIDVQLSLPVEVPWPSNELAIIFGNLLENAVDALTSQTEGTKSLMLKGYYTPNHPFFLIIDNTHRDPVTSTRHGGFRSTKHSGNGIGIRSVEKTVKKLGGTIDIDYDATTFRFSIMLP